MGVEVVKNGPAGGFLAGGAGSPTPWVGRRTLGTLPLSSSMLTHDAECSADSMLIPEHSASRDNKFEDPFVGASVMHPAQVPSKASPAARVGWWRAHIPTGTLKTRFLDEI